MTEGTDHRPDRIARFGDSADPIDLVRETLGKCRFGGITLTIHEGKLVQMEVTEKRSFI
jgi:hypothetical protein